MQNSKTILEKEKRELAAKEVIVRLTSTSTKGFHFNVYTNDLKEKTKYIGTISQDHTDDSCTCHSFMYGNNENYVKENPLPFQCKHIMKAHEMMDGCWP